MIFQYLIFLTTSDKVRHIAPATGNGTSISFLHLMINIGDRRKLHMFHLSFLSSAKILPSSNRVIGPAWNNCNPARYVTQRTDSLLCLGHLLDRLHSNRLHSELVHFVTIESCSPRKWTVFSSSCRLLLH